MNTMESSMSVVLLTYTCTEVGVSRLPCSAVDVPTASKHDASIYSWQMCVNIYCSCHMEYGVDDVHFAIECMLLMGLVLYW